MSDDVFCIIDKQLNCQGINVGIGIKKSLDKQPIDFDSVLLTKSKKYYFQNIQYQNTIKLSKVIILGTKKNNIYQIELLNNYNFIKEKGTLSSSPQSTFALCHVVYPLTLQLSTQL